MNKEYVLVPDTGSDGEVDVIEIPVAAGDMLEKEQTLIVLESDKATMEIPSPVAGKLLVMKLKAGDKVRSGDVIAEVEVDVSEQTPDENNSEAASAQSENGDTDGADNIPVSDENQTKADKLSAEKNKPEKELVDDYRSDVGENEQVHAGPAVRKFAREHGVDLVRVIPSGPKTRILLDDVSRYIKEQVQSAQIGQTALKGLGFADDQALPDFSQFGDISLQQMTKIHLKTAANMQRSWSIPQVTQFDEADITELEKFRKTHAQLAQTKGIKLTSMAFLLKACAYALNAMPQFNVSLDLARQQVIQKHYVNIGFAVDTPQGLLVPVIRDADKKGLWQLATECQELAAKAKERKLSPADMQGACFTISSLGGIGGTAFTPIVNFPEVAILGVSRAQLKPVFADEQRFEPRLMLPLSLSYDHRAVNGADGARFTSLLSRLLGDLRELLL
jgi:pyruvate dehydrogenase E2 component (dihydrolipoamide acetyltransferase)